MRRVFGTAPMRTGEAERATSVEIFFDLVFVFALTRVIQLMGSPPTPLEMAHGLLVLMLLWIAWSNYTWLGNQARIDTGVFRTGALTAMAAIFVIALVIPAAWRNDAATLDGPLTLALAYVALTGLHLILYFYAASGNPRLHTTLRRFAGVEVLSWVTLVAGALVGGTGQTLLWAAAFLITFVGGFLASVTSGWQLRSTSHFTERHDLAMIIVLGESLISVGAGVGPTLTRTPVFVAALLAFIATTCLWQLYFGQAAPAASRALGSQPEKPRNRVATDGYSLAHFPMIAGIIYIALGIEQVLAGLSHEPGDMTHQLAWGSITALYGGAAVYLTGRALFLLSATGYARREQFVAVGVVLLLIPVARTLPAVAALGLLTAFLIALVGYERFARVVPATAS